MHMHSHHINWHLDDWHLGHDTVRQVLVGVAALIGCLASAGAVALVLRIASGKW